MKSTWFGRLIRWLDGRAEAAGSTKDAAGGGARGGDNDRHNHARARRIGFFRFYGQRVIDAARAVTRRYRGKGLAERALLFGGGVAVVLGLALGWVWLGSRWPSPATPEPGLQELASQRPVESGESTGGAPASAGAPETLAPGAGSEAGLAASPAAVARNTDEGSSATGASSGPTTGAATQRDAGDAAGEPARATDVPETRQAPASSQAQAAQSTPATVAATRVEPSLPAVSVTSMVWPVSGGDLVRGYGWYRHPVFGDWRHSSTVVMRPGESGEVHAALAGRVRDVVDEGGLWRVTIDHAGGWRTEYEGLIEVAVGSYQVVETGEVIGRAERAGEYGVGFTVRQGEVAVNPVSLIGGGTVPVLAP